MNKGIKYLIGVLLILINSVGFVHASDTESIEYVPNIIIVKLKPSNSNYFQSVELSSLEVESVEVMFPNHAPLLNRSVGLVDLSLIYILHVSSTKNIEEIIFNLKEIPVFEYVEKKVIHKVSLVANDPEINKQSYLNQINALSAWDVSTGSVNIKVGIVDTGTDMDHPDLESEMHENTNDPINGIDDDNDGYIDNFNGWDFEENDNNPQVVDNDHGIHVAGIAAAASNNNEGVASVGFNTQYMPIRAGNGVAISYGYEGVVYAADMGCDIINCSWGDASYSELGQDAVNYATNNKGALVVAAAGNNGEDRSFYPAGFEVVLGVASVNSVDEKSSFSNYGHWVEISAPGQRVYSCVNDGKYNYNTGTSMASPVVAGAAALLKSVFPQLTAKQLKERLKTTSQNIDNLNVGLEHQIGSGRLDINAAVNLQITDASVIFENKKIENKKANGLKAGDSLFVSGTFTNYLASSVNAVEATVSVNSPYIDVNNTSVNLGVIPSLMQMDNYLNPFSFKIAENTPVNTKVTFELVITDGVFSNTQLIDVLVNVDYLNIEVNQLAVSIGGKGQVGYNDRYQSQGIGLRFKNGYSQLYESGLMIGTNSGNFIRVVDRVRSSVGAWDSDFELVEEIKEVSPTEKRQYQIKSVFDDSGAEANVIGFEVVQRAYASTDVGHENYVVLEYTIINKTTNMIKNVNVGMFADFDILGGFENAAYTDLSKRYNYTISTALNSELYGVQLLTSSDLRSYVLDNFSGGAGGVDLSNGFLTSDKFTTLTSNKYVGGITNKLGNDVAQVMSTGGFDIDSGDSIKVAFALIAAETKAELDMVADSAYARYNGFLLTSVSEKTNLTELVKIFPNPVKDQLTIDLSKMTSNENYSFTIKNVVGKELYFSGDLSVKELKIDVSEFNSGIYFVDFQIGDRKEVVKLIKK